MNPIAVVGLSCLFPQAETPEAYWKNLLNKTDSRTLATEVELEANPDRFYDKSKGMADKFYCARGGFIRDFSMNTDGFKISSAEIKALGSTFQWPLHVAREALKDSGYLEKEEFLKNCGVVLGNLSFPTKASNHLILPMYQQALQPVLQEALGKPDFKLLPFAPEKDTSEINSHIAGMPASMISKALGLSARSFALDAACASSLYAVALASYYLNSGKMDMMLAGAVNAADPFFVNMGFSIFHAYPDSSEKCNPLDQNSGGLYAGEGAGMFVLKRLQDAEKDGDKIHAVISGIGLSNDGRGQFVLSPNSKGQVLAYERAFKSADVSPDKIDYVECHATGTPLGDKVELNSMEQFFTSKDQARSHKPLIGSVKSNLGHMLTNAGMGGMIKVILSLQQGKIPATIGVQNALTSKDNGISADMVVTETTAWPHKNKERKAGVSAFGFGGTNAHLLIENKSSKKAGKSSKKGKNKADQTQQPLAIVGMEAIFGGCNGIQEFYQTIYDGKQHFKELPKNRWKGLDDHPELKNISRGAWLESFDMDFLRFKLQPNQEERLIPQQLLALEVSDRALKKTKIKEGQNVAVLVAMETDLELHRFRGRVNLSTQIEDSLSAAGISLSDSERKQLIETAKDSILQKVPINRFTSFIGNIMVTRIASLWDFSGPALTISSEENSVFRALEVAQLLLDENNTEAVDAVVIAAVDLAGSPEQILLQQRRTPLNTGKETLSFDQQSNGWMIGEGAGCVILKTPETAKKDQEQIFALLEAVAFSDGMAGENVANAAKSALQSAQINAADVGVLEAFGSGNPDEDQSEMLGLVDAYPLKKETQDQDHLATCALGAVKANIGHTFAASGMASLIKSTLSLHYRFIPGVPEWNSPKVELAASDNQASSRHAFYVPSESRPWLMQPGLPKRYAAISGLGQDQVSSHVILSEADLESRVAITEAETANICMFPVSGQDRSSVLQALHELQKDIEDGQNILSTSHQYYEKYKNNDFAYSAVIVGDNRERLIKEIKAANSGIEKAFDQDKEWNSPNGSSFTASPLGREGKMAFTYPGGFSSYLGTGRSLFQMYPELHQLDQEYYDNTGHDDDRSGSNYLGKLLHDHRIYPRVMKSLSDKEMEKLQEDFIHSPIAMFESGVSSAVLNTHVMRHGFGLEPDMAFGYSMGEISMLFGLGVWGSMSHMSDPLNSSSLFKERLAGPMNSVREAWNLAPDEYRDKPLWGCYTLRIKPDKVLAEIENEPRVYLILVNTPEEVVIAGEPEACEKVIKKFKRPIHAIPVTDVVHCDPVKAEYQEIKRIHTDDVIARPNIDFYSAIDYKVSKLESEALGHNIATIYGRTVDYSKLINTIYDDGARIFVDMGPRVTCSKWISKTLSDRPHLSVSVNRKGADDRSMIIQALARLTSHQVPLNLEPLFANVSTQPERKLPQSITLGGTPISEVFSKNISQKLGTTKPAASKYVAPQPRAQEAIPRATSKTTVPITTVSAPMSQPTTVETNLGQPARSEVKPQAIQNLMPINISSDIIPSFSPFPGEYGTRRNAAHSAFLDVRQQGMRQIAELIGNITATVGDVPYTAPEQFQTRALDFKAPTNVSSESQIVPSQNLSTDIQIPRPARKECIFDYDDLLEIAGGDISKVFGPEYAEIDQFRRYVRLPMEPYLLVSRVTKLNGKLGEFKPSTVTTEYDIPENAWYTTDGQIPWAVAVESGQCDLLLISYLGIDFECKGDQVYRLLDCTLTYLEDMPLEGQTLRYDISINSFARHDNNLLFFFNYECFVGDKMVLRMDGGCAGFFSDEDLAHGRGVIHTAQEMETKQQAQKTYFPPLLECAKTTFSREELLEISNGNPAGCFGPDYNQFGKNPSLKNAPDQFLMSDRVLSVEPQGGAYGLGMIVAEKDLSPDDWFFPCHFKDDPVMAGSLMAEGCVQLLQFYLLHLGLQTLVEDATFQPIHELSQIVRCRGQVIPGDPKITYRVEVKEIGLEPHPYAIADIDIIVEGRIVVDFRDLGVQLAEKNNTERVSKSHRKAYDGGKMIQTATPIPAVQRQLVADEQMIWEFALGDVEKCFGDDFSIYRGRPMQRNPNGDLQLLSRVYDITGKRMELNKPMTLVSEYDVPADAWFFTENSYPTNMPYSVLMEIALQPCGFISTDSGAILTYPNLDLCYRNLDGNGTLLNNPDLRGKTIVNEIKLLSTVASGNTIIQSHSFSLSCDGVKFYEGDTVFGYFSHEALTNQIGLDGGKIINPWFEDNPEAQAVIIDLNSPDFRSALGENPNHQFLHLCNGQLSFSDFIHLSPEGGKHGKGYAYARKEIDVNDWFFPCHFHEDPVMPGSLGVEAIIQALQAFALHQGLGSTFQDPRFVSVLSKVRWKYRGQIIPQNKYMQLELHVKQIEQRDGQIQVIADASLWRDNIRIYEIYDIIVGITEA